MISIGSIIWLLVIVGLFFFMMKKGGGCCGGHDHGAHNNGLKAKITKDPVCGMDVDEHTEFTENYDGTQYYFCSAGCLNQFRREPASHVGDAAKGMHDHGGGCCH